MTPDSGGPERGRETLTEDERAARSFGRYAGVGLQFAVSVVLFVYAGQWLDRRLGTAPWFLLAGAIVGASAAFYSMYHRLMADLEREERAKRERSGRP